MILKLLEVTEDLGIWWVVSLIIPVIIIIMFLVCIDVHMYVYIDVGTSLITRVLSA